jgi:hypothetical protein
MQSVRCFYHKLIDLILIWSVKVKILVGFVNWTMNLLLLCYFRNGGHIRPLHQYMHISLISLLSWRFFITHGSHNVSAWISHPKIKVRVHLVLITRGRSSIVSVLITNYDTPFNYLHTQTICWSDALRDLLRELDASQSEKQKLVISSASSQ